MLALRLVPRAASRVGIRDFGQFRAGARARARANPTCWFGSGWGVGNRGLGTGLRVWLVLAHVLRAALGGGRLEQGDKTRLVLVLRVVLSGGPGLEGERAGVVRSRYGARAR